MLIGFLCLSEPLRFFSARPCGFANCLNLFTWDFIRVECGILPSTEAIVQALFGRPRAGTTQLHIYIFENVQVSGEEVYRLSGFRFRFLSSSLSIRFSSNIPLIPAKLPICPQPPHILIP